jgi:hypothetical protein
MLLELIKEEPVAGMPPPPGLDLTQEAQLINKILHQGHQRILVKGTGFPDEGPDGF